VTRSAPVTAPLLHLTVVFNTLAEPGVPAVPGKVAVTVAAAPGASVPIVNVAGVEAVVLSTSAAICAADAATLPAFFTEIVPMYSPAAFLINVAVVESCTKGAIR
jgi:hypothetical protein